MNRERQMDIAAVDQLPVECISHIISLTTPRDACISSTVCPIFKSAADLDSVWEKFLPSDYNQIISNSDLYFHLCHNPIIINNGAMSFSLEKESGKKCYMAGARSLCIAWGDTPKYWKWTSLPQSRPKKKKDRIETKILSIRTNYAAYLVFKFIDTRYGFETRPVDFGVYFDGSDNGERRKVVLDPPANMPKLSQDRGNGWMEIEMGEFFNETGEDGTVVCSVFGFDDAKSGIIIQGIELRPKSGR
ncbi:hypothetical protein CUMW_279090 [Citrus unshiu]|uniref:F-box domain-containing protein n=1 Tax=Citrus unshiu TaxID=55188 RepID=A0A2H5N7Z9_CITUN|nr:hypothetical protein CUMW_279090 [Citrus unshiu]